MNHPPYHDIDHTRQQSVETALTSMWSLHLVNIAFSSFFQRLQALKKVGGMAPAFVNSCVVNSVENNEDIVIVYLVEGWTHPHGERLPDPRVS